MFRSGTSPKKWFCCWFDALQKTDGQEINIPRIVQKILLAQRQNAGRAGVFHLLTKKVDLRTLYSMVEYSEFYSLASFPIRAWGQCGQSRGLSTGGITRTLIHFMAGDIISLVAKMKYHSHWLTSLLSTQLSVVRSPKFPCRSIVYLRKAKR